MANVENSFLNQCKALGKKEKVVLIIDLNRMMDTDLEGTFYDANANLTGTGLLIKDFIKILGKRGKTDEGIS